MINGAPDPFADSCVDPSYNASEPASINGRDKNTKSQSNRQFLHEYRVTIRRNTMQLEVCWMI